MKPITIDVPAFGVSFTETPPYQTAICVWLMKNKETQALAITTTLVIAMSEEDFQQQLDYIVSEQLSDFEVMDVRWQMLRGYFEQIDDEFRAMEILTMFDENVDKEGGDK
jgi:hypothetical protein